MIKVGIIGTRGIPNRYGGFEAFVEALVTCRDWSKAGIQFVIFGEHSERHFSSALARRIGVRKDSHPQWYYLKSLIMACQETDVVISCGVGVHLFAVLSPLTRTPLIVNPDGCEWRRSKWSLMGRLFIKLMYQPALFLAHQVVLDARCLTGDFGKLIRDKSTYLAYPAPQRPLNQEPVLRSNFVDQNLAYILVIARLEPENSIEIILDAFEALGSSAACELLIVGSKETRYYRQHLAQRQIPRANFLGAIFDQKVLASLRDNSIAYIHGHTVGGTNPSLLEAAMSFTPRIFCHDNKYNREVIGGAADYFCDSRELTELMLLAIAEPHECAELSVARQEKIAGDERFDINIIARGYERLINHAANSVNKY